MKVLFSSPDMGMEEVSAVTEAILSDWITTGPKTKNWKIKSRSTVEFRRRCA